MMDFSLEFLLNEQEYGLFLEKKHGWNSLEGGVGRRQNGTSGG